MTLEKTICLKLYIKHRAMKTLSSLMNLQQSASESGKRTMEQPKKYALIGEYKDQCLSGNGKY